MTQIWSCLSDWLIILINYGIEFERKTPFNDAVVVNIRVLVVALVYASMFCAARFIARVLKTNFIPIQMQKARP